MLQNNKEAASDGRQARRLLPFLPQLPLHHTTDRSKQAVVLIDSMQENPSRI